MKKITINMLSSADKVAGQGVGSAYLEQVSLIKEEASNLFDVVINSKKEADIIHCHTIEPTYLMRMKANKGVNVAYVHFLPDTLDGSIKLPKMAFGVFKNYVIKFYNSADYLVVVNPIFINDLVRNGIAKEKIRYIPNYVSKDKFYKKSETEVNEIRNKLGYSKEDFIVLGVGQVQTRKGVMDFIEVAKKLPEVKFVWCGGFSFGVISDGYDELKKVYENPPANVKFLGIVPRDEMNDMFNMADVLFMPSYNELFPMAILEAVNTEKPLLLRDLELYEDILFHKYIKASDNDSFTDKIRMIRADKDLYNKYSKQAKEISEYYTKENVVKIWKAFYTDIYSKKREEEAVNK